MFSKCLGNIIILHLLPSLKFQRVTAGGLVDTGGQRKREQENDDADGHTVTIQASVFLAVHIAQRHIRCAVRPAAGHGLDKQERHVDGGDNEEGQGGADVRPDEGDGDLEELGQPPGASVWRT